MLTAFRDGESRSVIVLALAIEALTLAYGAIVATVLGDVDPTSPADMVRLWRHWDANIYLAIAEHGYQATPGNRTLGFFPLFPAMVNALSRLLIDPLVSAFLIVTVFGAVAAVVLYRLAALDDPRSARAAALGLLLFPTSFVLHIPYSESVFMALVVSAFYAARRDHWIIAGVCGGLAAATRANGVLLLPALAIEAHHRWRAGGRACLGYVALGLIPIGTLAYLGINYVVAGDPWYFMDLLRDYWEKSATAPWTAVTHLVRLAAEPSPGRVLWIGELSFVVLAIAATVASALMQRTSYAVWMGANTLLFISQGTPVSVPRYTLALFPVFLLIARWSPRERLAAASVSTVLLCLLTGRFVLGQWAF